MRTPAPGTRGRRRNGLPQAAGVGERAELLQRLALDLADALAGDVEHAAQLVQRAGLLAAQAVAELEHAALPVRELVEQVAERLLAEAGLGGDLRGDGVL